LDNAAEQPEVKPLQPASRKSLKVFMVYNPVAGSDDAGAGLEEIKGRFEETDWQFKLYETTGEENIQEIVRTAIQDEAYDLVLAAGGDGTVANVASGLIGSEVPLGIIPLGTGNMLAQELDIPPNAEGALDVLTGHFMIKRLDAMHIPGKDAYYFIAISIGVSSAIMQNTRREQKRRFGFFAYIWNAIVQFTGLRLNHFRMRIDGKSLTGWASEVLIINTGLLGVKRVRSELGILPDDGKVEACILRSRTFLDIVKVIWNLLILQGKKHPEFQCMDARERIVIETGDPITIEADGEVVGETPVEIEVIPRAVRIVVPTAQQEGRGQRLIDLLLPPNGRETPTQNFG
jgi:YegS/Rv2252/BmrU family lipid kinase